MWKFLFRFPLLSLHDGPWECLCKFAARVLPTNQTQSIASIHNIIHYNCHKVIKSIILFSTLIGNHYVARLPPPMTCHRCGEGRAKGCTQWGHASMARQMLMLVSAVLGCQRGKIGVAWLVCSTLPHHHPPDWEHARWVPVFLSHHVCFCLSPPVGLTIGICYFQASTSKHPGVVELVVQQLPGGWSQLVL